MSVIGIDGLISSTTGKNEAKSQGSVKGVKVSTPDIYKSKSVKRHEKSEGKSLPSKPSGKYKQEISHAKYSPKELSRDQWVNRINKIMYGIQNSNFRDHYKSFKSNKHFSPGSRRASGFANSTGYKQGSQGMFRSAQGPERGTR